MTTTEVPVRPFQVQFLEEDLVNLHRRIAATRWPSRELVADRSQGVQLATTQELARYWETDYDWRRCEARLNALPQFKTEIEGVDTHFIHVKSTHANALPLMLTHGWPGSVIEMLEVVGPLTDPPAYGGRPEDAFDLVVPSIPGYGFSAEPTELGWHSGRVAQAWAELMRRLGYDRYVAQGGDQGAAVTDAMGRQAPKGLAGIHTNLLVPALGGASEPTETEQERAAARGAGRVQKERLRLLSGTGYAAPNHRLCPAGLARGPGGLDDRPRHGQLLQDLPRLPRQAAGRQPDQGPHPRQHHAVLVDGHRGLGRPVLLGRRTSYSSGRRPGSCASIAPGRVHHVPGRDFQGPAQLGRKRLPGRQLLQRGRKGRPFRRLGRASTFFRRGSCRLPVTSLADVFLHLHISCRRADLNTCSPSPTA